MDEPENPAETGSPALPDAAPGAVRPVLSVDLALFDHHLAEADLTEQEKREFLGALWYIVCTFVDLGFGIEPVQQALAAGEALTPAHTSEPQGGEQARLLTKRFRDANGNKKSRSTRKAGKA